LLYRLYRHGHFQRLQQWRKDDYDDDDDADDDMLMLETLSIIYASLNCAASRPEPSIETTFLPLGGDKEKTC